VTRLAQQEGERAPRSMPLGLAGRHGQEGGRPVTVITAPRWPYMDDDFLDADCSMLELTEPRLALFTLSEAHELLDVLHHFGTTDHDWGTQARHFAAELAARVPSREG
jgi:hypothetical protein